MRYITETRNLFDPSNRTEAVTTGNWPITKYDVGNVIYRGFAYSGYYQLDEPYKCQVTRNGSLINISQKVRNYGVGYTVRCTPNTTYTLSLETNLNTIHTLFLDSEGNKLGGSWNRTFTTPDNTTCLLLSLSATTVGDYYIRNLQLEEGSVATTYNPAGYLPMRRMKYKVSNVCQLLDKRTFPATTTIANVTFNNNGDGSYTVSGVTTSSTGYGYLNLINNFKLKEGHIYLNGGNKLTGCYEETVFIDENKKSYWANRYKADSNSTVRLGIIRHGTTDNVVTLFPQLFDLTEIYGVGNEPATLDEFRADFPDDLYEYTPYCWASMKNIRYLDTTKNLLDMNSYLQLTNSNIIINGNSIFCVATNKNASVSYKIPTVIGEKYTVSNKSFIRGGLDNVGYGLFLSNKSDRNGSPYLGNGLQSGQSFTFTASSEFLYIHCWVCYAFDSNNPSTLEINELQVNLGDTATPYVPYGYLPLK